MKKPKTFEVPSQYLFIQLGTDWQAKAFTEAFRAAKGHGMITTKAARITVLDKNGVPHEVFPPIPEPVEKPRGFWARVFNL